MSYSPKFILRFNYIIKQSIHYYLVQMEVMVVSPNIAPSRILVKADIYELNQTLDYKQNKNFINGIQQTRRGSS